MDPQILLGDDYECIVEWDNPPSDLLCKPESDDAGIDCTDDPRAPDFQTTCKISSYEMVNLGRLIYFCCFCLFFFLHVFKSCFINITEFWRNVTSSPENAIVDLSNGTTNHVIHCNYSFFGGNESTYIFQWYKHPNNILLSENGRITSG